MNERKVKKIDGGCTLNLDQYKNTSTRVELSSLTLIQASVVLDGMKMGSTSTSSTVAALDFSGKRVLVTGGGQGIGKAIAIKFQELNAHVIVLDKEEKFLNAIKEAHPSIETVQVDLRDWEATRKAVESVLPIHHLANNAGIAPTRSFLEIDLEHIDLVFDVNFKAALNVGQVVAKGMIAHGIKNGTIVNTSSISDEIVIVDTAIYGATKAALTMLTKTMAVELAPHGIRVNCVCPGLVNTELIQNHTEEFKIKFLGPILERLLFHEASEPEAVANAVVFLSSPMASRITAARLLVDQGTSVQ